MEKKVKELHNEYSKRNIKINKLKLCIVGQDIYPNGYEGIAFYKENINELFKNSCSGKIVLESLGYTEEYVRKVFKTSKDLLFHLLEEEKIAFTNIAYHLIKGDKNKIEDWIHYNEPFFKNSEKIILLGKGITQKLFKKYYPNYHNTVTFLHPSYRIKNEEWKQTWKQNSLKELIH